MVYPEKVTRNGFDAEKFVYESLMATANLSYRLCSALSISGNIEAIHRKNNIKREILAVENLLAVLQNPVVSALNENTNSEEDGEEGLVLDAVASLTIAKKINRRLRRIEYKIKLIEASPSIKHIKIGKGEEGETVVDVEYTPPRIGTGIVA